MSETLLDLSKPKHMRADERLRNDLMAWLSTVRPDGRPHLVPIWFLWDGATLLVFSKNDQKIRNLQRSPQAIVALDDTEGGDDVVMIEGDVTLPERGSVTPALPAYAEKYASKLAEFGWTGESMAQEYTEPIRITPTRFWVW